MDSESGEFAGFVVTGSRTSGNRCQMKEGRGKMLLCHTENRCQMEEGRWKMLLCHTDITDNTEIRWMMEEKKPGRKSRLFFVTIVK